MIGLALDLRDGGQAGATPAAEEAAEFRDALEFNQQSEALRGALTLLTREERQAIATAFFSELTYAETAARLDQPLGTVKTRIRSALHKLRQALTDEGTKR
jgi:RNA polymerase sigma-70 factor (ECF subfamily)